MAGAPSGVRKDSALPLYVQVRNAPVERIRRGAYPPGTLLPGEAALAGAFGVTRMTVRQALGTLREAGLISTDKGRGSRVTGPRIEQSLLRFYSFGRRFREAGEAFSSRVLEALIAEPPAEVRGRFAPAPRGRRGKRRFYRIVRVRILGETPLILERATIPVDAAPGLTEHDLASESIYDILERDCGQVISGATEYLEPRIIGEEDAAILGVDAGSAVFATERETRNASGELIELRFSLIRGDQIRFSTELTLGPEYPRARKPADVAHAGTVT